MKRRKYLRIIAYLFVLLQCSVLSGCTSGTVISTANTDTGICMEVAGYTGRLDRTLTIKNTQSGAFSVGLSPSAGCIEITVTDGNGNAILSINEKATLLDTPSIAKVAKGNGTYQVTIVLEKYSGSFDITWTVKG